MKCDHTFSQKNKTTERAVGWGVGGKRVRGESWTKFEQNLKKGRGNIGDIHKIGEEG